jgi:hypothetical protein
MISSGMFGEPLIEFIASACCCGFFWLAKLKGDAPNNCAFDRHACLFRRFDDLKLFGNLLALFGPFDARHCRAISLKVIARELVRPAPVPKAQSVEIRHSGL